MKVAVAFDMKELNRVLDLPNGKKRLAYAASQGINRTLFAIAAEEKEELPKHFTIRKAWTQRQAARVEVKADPKQGRPYGEVAVARVERLFLGAFEQGAMREPVVGKHVAMPVIGGPARRSERSTIPKRFEFETMDFRPGKGGKSYISADGSLYLIPGVGVFRRNARSGEGEIVYSFVDPFKLDARLSWYATALRVYGRDLSRFVAEEVAMTLERHKNSGSK